MFHPIYQECMVEIAAAYCIWHGIPPFEAIHARIVYYRNITRIYPKETAND
jgi:hypothetical protein